MESFTTGVLTQGAALVLLVSLRVGIAMASLPAPFGALSPTRIRVALGVLIAFALSTPRTDLLSSVHLDIPWLLQAGFGEVLLGTVIGLTARVTLAVADIAGSFVGLSMGMGFGGTVDPNYEEPTPSIAQALSAFTTLIFFALHGHHAVLAALGNSLHTAPPGETFVVLADDGVMRLGSTMVAHGLRIASPVVATMFLVQLGTALISKVAPRVHLFTLTFAIAVSAGALVLYTAMPSIATSLSRELERLNETLIEPPEAA